MSLQQTQERIMLKKTPPQKKRHTKPCKYFQFNRCPHDGATCDFAHVLVPPASPTYLPRVHIPGPRVFIPPIYPLAAQLGAHPHKPEETSPTSPRGDWLAEWEASSLSPTFERTASYGEHPPMYGFYSPPHTQRWFSPPPMSALGSPTTTIVSPSRSRDSISTQSTSTSTESEEVNIITTDPKFSEHSHPFQSQVRVTDDVPVVHVSPYGGALPMYSPTNLCFPHPIPKAKVKLPSKRKVLKYKTKPCKFFTPEKGCPNGQSCTFIHDESDLIARFLAPKEGEESSSSEDESGNKAAFFPIPWRVIGGGVLVGVQQEQIEEVKTPVLAPRKPLTRQRSNSIPSKSSPVSVKVGQLFSAESPGVL